MDIKIGKSARVCSECGQLFVHEQSMTSIIRPGDAGFIRTDFCEGCWRDARAEGAFSVWSAQFYDPQVAEQGPPEAFTPLRQSFYEAVEQEGRETMAMAYLAAQLLRRQKVFRLIKETPDPDTDVSMLLFSDRIGNRLIEVQDPSLTHGELDDGRKRLMARLSELENSQAEEGGDDGQSEDEYAQV